MSFFNKLFGIDTEQEENIDVFISEKEKTAYRFQYVRKQWIRERRIEHEITGEIDTNISQRGENTFKWQVHLRNMVCKEKTNSIPEFYLFWDYIQRIDFFTDKKGQIVYITTIYGEDEIYKEKTKRIKQSDMDNDRKHTALSILKEIKNDLSYKKILFEKNPVIILLCKNLEFFVKNTMSNNSLPVQTYHSNEIIPDYFGENFHLPIKKYSSWDKRDENNILAACVGGIDKELLDKDKFFRYIRKIAGKINTGRELFLDYSECYQYDKRNSSNIGDFGKAEIYMETAVADAWYLEEQTVLNNLNE